jgi:hypothetical protein
MSKADSPVINQQELVDAWQNALPNTLNASDKATVLADESNPNGIRIHIQCAGHSDYSFDFACTYVDSREVKVQLVDAESGHVSIDERNERVQQLIEDYVRHIHECAQVLHAVTHS